MQREVFRRRLHLGRFQQAGKPDRAAAPANIDAADIGYLMLGMDRRQIFARKRSRTSDFAVNGELIHVGPSELWCLTKQNDGTLPTYSERPAGQSTAANATIIAGI